MKIKKILNVEFWKYYFYLYVGTNHICITCILLNKKCYLHVVNIAWMADLENKTVHFQYIMHKYQCYRNRNHLLNYNLSDHWLYTFTSSCQMAKVLQKISLNSTGPRQPCKLCWMLLSLVAYILFLLNAK